MVPILVPSERRTGVPSTRSLATNRCGLAGIVNVACVCACICIFASTILAARIFCRSLDNAARKKRTFHQHAKRRRGRNVPSATNARFGSKHMRCKKGLSALPPKADVHEPVYLPGRD